MKANTVVQRVLYIWNAKKKMVALSTMLEYLPDALKKLHRGTLISSLHTRLYRFTSNCHVPSSYKEA